MNVIAALNVIIADSIKTKSRAGYFATLYLKVTTSVKDGIIKNQFQNGPRMEQLDVTFANRYLEAYYQWQNKITPTASWQLAFKETEKSSVLILVQLLLGMSAHINLDLGIATAQTQTANGGPLEDIHNDYDTMNTIIGSLTYQAPGRTGQSFPIVVPAWPSFRQCRFRFNTI